MQVLPVPLPRLAEQERIVAAIEEHLSRLDAALAPLSDRLGARRAALRQASCRLTSSPHRARLGDQSRSATGSGNRSAAAPQATPSGDGADAPTCECREKSRQLEDASTTSSSQEFDRIGRSSSGIVAVDASTRSERAASIARAPERRSTDGASRPDVQHSQTPHAFERIDVPTSRFARASPGFAVSATLSAAAVRFETAEFPLPPLMSRHQRCAARVDRRPRRTAQIHAKRRKPSLRRSILAARLLRRARTAGPDDEPASVLLERIRAERLRPPTKRTRKARRIVSDTKAIVDKLWNYCNVLRDDGLSYGDYVEQLTYLLFLKMADEQTQAAAQSTADRARRARLAVAARARGRRAGGPLPRTSSTSSGSKPGMLGVIFRKAQNRIQDPAKLRRLIDDLIDREQWMTPRRRREGRRLRGAAGEERRGHQDRRGQYFTPRPLIRAMVDVMQPEPGMTICDPACGTGGFLLAAYDYIAATPRTLDPDQKRHLRYEALHGWEIVDNTARLCAMNLLLHGIGADESDSPVHVDDACAADPGDRFDMVLTNPPFGKKSSRHDRQRRGRGRAREPDDRARRLLGVDLEQAAQLRAARQDAAEDQRPRRGGRARQRAVRGRRRRDGPPQAARTSATSTPCCACRPASSTPRA